MIMISRISSTRWIIAGFIHNSIVRELCHKNRELALQLDPSMRTSDPQLKDASQSLFVDIYLKN